MIMHRLHKMGFMNSKSYSSLFIQKVLKGPVCILLYIDDLAITSPDLAKIDQVKSQLLDAFEMKDLRDVHYFLEVEVGYS